MKWPGKRPGAIGPAPDAKLTGLYLDNSGHSFAQACRHEVTRVEQMPQGHTHHARVICATCRCHVRWLPKPGTVERQRLNAFRLARLAMVGNLSDWEREFLRSISQQPQLSPAQQRILDRLVAHYLEGTP
jgi:hypothetical protein